MTFNVIGFNEFSTNSNCELHCWLCQKGVTSRALFCHHCGTIQPIRDIDHFARLGLERRVDIDMEQLEHQYQALSRTLDPQRFMIRGIGERGHASKQLEALHEAYDVLHEPLRRGRYWLSLHKYEAKRPIEAHPLIKELQRDLESADEPSQYDRVAQRAGHAMERGIVGFLQALRGEDWGQANNTLGEIDGLETILGEVRSRRNKLTEQGRTV